MNLFDDIFDQKMDVSWKMSFRFRRFRLFVFWQIEEALIVAFELMGQQYSLVVKVFQDHALVLKDLAVLNQDGLASKSLGTLFRDLTFLSFKIIIDCSSFDLCRIQIFPGEMFL